MHDFNAFITLTYDDEHLPDDYSVNVRTFQLFMKRLRKALPHQIRYFACGEYGDTTLRPHYHALIFNHHFSDQKFFKNSPTHTQYKNKIYTSQTLNKIWSQGECFIGNVSYQSAAYVARYTLKKLGGDAATVHYSRVHPLTGRQVQVEPEFCVGSRRPGIASSWFDQFKSDIYPSDFLIVDAKKHPVPRYYLNKLLEEENQWIKRRRKAEANKHRDDNTPARLAVREEVKLAQIKQLKREL